MRQERISTEEMKIVAEVAASKQSYETDCDIVFFDLSEKSFSKDIE